MSVCASCGHAAAGDFQFCPECGTRTVAGGGFVGRTIVGKYRITALLGEGSTGVVYRAEHVALRRPVAIKMLHRELQVDDDALHRFQREGIAAGRLQHPNAVQVFDFDRTEDGRLFLAMEFVEGQSLRDVLKERGALPPADALAIARQLLSVLDAAHAADIVHRDLKPENLMLASAPGEIRLVVLDFGLSKLLRRPVGETTVMTHAGRVVGTPQYMAPEQWHGDEADERTDVHAAGLVLFEMLAGKPPFAARDVTEAMLTSTGREVPRLHEVAPQRQFPAGVEAIVAKALARDREERWPSAAAMLEAIEAVDANSVAAPGSRPRHRRAEHHSTGHHRTGHHRAAAVTKPATRKAPWVALGVVVLGLAVALFASLGGDGVSAAASPLVRERPAADRSPEATSYLALLDAGADELRRGQIAAALSVFGRALQSREADAEGLLLRAQALRANAQPALAAADLDEAQKRHPQWPAPCVERGFLELERQDLPAAERAFAAALTLDGGDPDAVAGRAAVLRQRGDAAAASQLLLGIAEPERDRPAVLLERGLCELQLGKTREAVATLATVRQRDAFQWRAAEALGDAHAAAGDFAAAAQQWREALGLCERPAVRAKLLETLLAEGRFQQAEQELPARGTGDGVLDVSVRALAARARGDAPATAALLAENRVDDAPLQALLACLELQRGRFREANAAAQRAAELDESLPEAWLACALAQHRLGNPVTAAQQLLQLCAQRPDDAFAHRARGILCMDWLLQADAALAHLRRCRDLGRSDAIVDQRIATLEGWGADADAAPVPEATAPAAPTAAGAPRRGRDLAVRAALAQTAERVRNEIELHEDHDSWDKAWEARTAHFAVRTTHSHGLAADLASGLELMLANVQQTLAVDRQPTRVLPVHVLPAVADYNTFGEQFGQEHSSFFASFFAPQHQERPVASVFERNPTLLRLQLTHSMVHQYVADAFPQARLPVWVDEGLAAHFSFWWDYQWARSEFERLRAANALPRLGRLLRDDLAAYSRDTHARMVTLGMLFYWLLRYREDTMTTPEQAPFRDWLAALLHGRDAGKLPFQAVLGDMAALESAFAEFTFPQ